MYRISRVLVWYEPRSNQLNGKSIGVSQSRRVQPINGLQKVVARVEKESQLKEAATAMKRKEEEKEREHPAIDWTTWTGASKLD
jgi:hypothetical protein